jgi:hypothetical protein
MSEGFVSVLFMFGVGACRFECWLALLLLLPLLCISALHRSCC